ncbi:MAG: ABC transporter ATP-binding protein [Caldilineaceae bacterium SB0664_bin_27]|uniref:ABC transporter ATP-binding protein n=1 Tax=Caldilineaceae bacterium SB0664_bin_27 TaxID=2605260 RepID=A0A6B0YVH6_9CHLR|nr:ABC transporter ATP-binding protein [Caldilineaceae bacterium SB0664_bin_27]
MRSPTSTEIPQSAFTLLKEELRSQIPRIAILFALALVSTGMGLIQPFLFKLLIDTAIPTADIRLIGLLLVGMVVVPILSAGLNAANHYLRAYIGESVSQRLRRDLFDHLLRVRLVELEKFKTGEHLHRLTRSCGRIGDLFVGNHLLPLALSAILLLGTLAAMTALHWRLTLLTLIAFPLSLLLTRKTRNHSQRLDRDFSSILEAGQSYLTEFFPGMRTIRAFNAERHEEARWQDWLVRHRSIRAKAMAFHEMIRIVLPETVNYVAAGLVFGYGALEIVQGRLTIGSLVAFAAYLPRAYAVLQSLLGTQVNLQEARVNAEKVDALFALSREPSGGRVLPPSGTSRVRSAAGATSYAGAALAFNNVSFDYGRGDFGARDLTFRVEPGEFVGIVGPSGGGKSTIIDLIMGFYAPQSGSIALDGIDLQELSLTSLRDQIGLVSQDLFFWNDSIRRNINYPRAEDDSGAISEAARAAQIDEFITSLPLEYRTVIGERGLTLSGGERQRLAIARALRKHPKLLLLDEATSALDALTELKVRDAFEKARAGRTAVVVAHRLSTILNADRILVIDQGRIVEIGSRDELLTRRGLFHDLYKAQSFDLPAIAL